MGEQFRGEFENDFGAFDVHVEMSWRHLGGCESRLYGKVWKGQMAVQMSLKSGAWVRSARGQKWAGNYVLGQN